MAIGLQTVSRADLDAAAIQVAKTLRDTFMLVERLKAELDLHTDDMLTELGYSTDDIYLFRLLTQELNDLALIATGMQAGTTTVTNYLTHSNSILGLQ